MINNSGNVLFLYFWSEDVVIKDKGKVLFEVVNVVVYIVVDI